MLIFISNNIGFARSGLHFSEIIDNKTVRMMNLDGRTFIDCHTMHTHLQFDLQSQIKESF